MFLPGDASDSDNDDGDEPAKKEERRRVLGNSGAQVSRADISGVSNRDGYHMVNGGSGDGVAREAPSEGGLSAKAGIILVRGPTAVS